MPATVRSAIGTTRPRSGARAAGNPTRPAAGIPAAARRRSSRAPSTRAEAGPAGAPAGVLVAAGARCPRRGASSGREPRAAAGVPGTARSGPAPGAWTRRRSAGGVARASGIPPTARRGRGRGATAATRAARRVIVSRRATGRTTASGLGGSAATCCGAAVSTAAGLPRARPASAGPVPVAAIDARRRPVEPARLVTGAAGGSTDAAARATGDRPARAGLASPGRSAAGVPAALRSRTTSSATPRGGSGSAGVRTPAGTPRLATSVRLLRHYTLRVTIKMKSNCWQIRRWGPPQWPPSRKCVRRRPTLPRSLPRSTIGAEGLSFRVRDGTGRFPFAMIAETLWRCGHLTIPREPHSGRETRIMWQVLGLLVPVSYMRCRTSTSGLSTRWSTRGPYSIKGWETSS